MCVVVAAVVATVIIAKIILRDFGVVFALQKPGNLCQ